jgi:hypothetical protein
VASLYANLEKGRPYILSVLRIVVALLFLEHGLQKYFGFPSAGPAMTPLLYVQGAIEVVGGILLLVGAYTRVVAFILAGAHGDIKALVVVGAAVFPVPRERHLDYAWGIDERACGALSAMQPVTKMGRTPLRVRIYGNAPTENRRGVSDEIDGS